MSIISQFLKNAYFRKEMFQINDLSCHLKKLEKEQIN